jgi:hypothetical protein
VSSQRFLVLATSAAALVIAVTACASDDDPEAAPGPDAGTEETSTTDAGTSDADVTSDAGDASRTCSDQNFCHTALPGDETVRDVWSDGTVVWAVSEQGHVLRWDGAAWTVHASKLGALYAVWGSGPTDLWVGGAHGLYHGTGGTSQSIVFERATAPGDTTLPILSISGTSANDVWAVGGHTDEMDLVPRGRVLHWLATGGQAPSWELDAISSEPFVFKRVWGSAMSGVWVAGDDGTKYSQSSALLRRGPSDNDFVAQTVDAFNGAEGPDYGIPGAITGAGWGADGQIVLIGATKSNTPSIWFATPDGSGAYTWSYEKRDESDQTLYAVWGVEGGTTWVGGEYGRLRSRTGTKWTQAALMIADLPIVEPLHAMWGTKADDFWVVGRNTAIHHMRAP